MDGLIAELVWVLCSLLLVVSVLGRHPVRTSLDRVANDIDVGAEQHHETNPDLVSDLLVGSGVVLLRAIECLRDERPVRFQPRLNRDADEGAPPAQQDFRPRWFRPAARKADLAAQLEAGRGSLDASAIDHPECDE